MHFRKEFAILAIQPLDCPDGRLKITVRLSWVNYRRGKLQLGIDSWADVYLRHDTSRCRVNGLGLISNLANG